MVQLRDPHGQDPTFEISFHNFLRNFDSIDVCHLGYRDFRIPCDAGSWEITLDLPTDTQIEFLGAYQRDPRDPQAPLTTGIVAFLSNDKPLAYWGGVTRSTFKRITPIPGGMRCTIAAYCATDFVLSIHYTGGTIKLLSQVPGSIASIALHCALRFGERSEIVDNAAWDYFLSDAAFCIWAVETAPGASVTVQPSVKLTNVKKICFGNDLLGVYVTEQGMKSIAIERKLAITRAL